MAHNSVVEELALIASAWQFWWIALAALPEWIQHGTGLADWQNTRADSRAVASSWLAAAGPGIRDFKIIGATSTAA